MEASASTITGSHDLRVVALSEQIETLSAIVALMQEHKAALLAEGSAMEVVAANQQELMTQTTMISSQLDYELIRKLGFGPALRRLQIGFRISSKRGFKIQDGQACNSSGRGAVAALPGRGAGRYNTSYPDSQGHLARREYMP